MHFLLERPPTLCDSSVGPPITLVCLPYAGGSAQIYARWGHWLAPDIVVKPIELPGHGVRLRSLPDDRMEDLLEEVLPALESLCEQPYALFGHDTGALIAYELSRQLADSRCPPERLFVSASRAPHLPGNGGLEALARAREKVLHTRVEDPEDPIQQALTADLNLDRSYRCPGSHLQFPVTIFGGVNDDSLSLDELAAWSALSSGPCSLQLLPGGHFYIHSQERLLTFAIRRAFDRHRQFRLGESTS